MSTKTVHRRKPSDSLMSGFSLLSKLADTELVQASSLPISAEAANKKHLEKTEGRVAELDSSATSGYSSYELSKVYGVGERLLLPLDKILENSMNPRVFFFENEIQSLINSIAKVGQLAAVQVYAEGDGGFFTLKSGHRRCRALKFLNREFVKVEIVSGSSDSLEEYKEARDLNVEHKSQSHFDDAVRFAQLLENKVVLNQKALAEALGLPEAEISKCMSVSGLPVTLIEKMAENASKFGLTAAHTVFRFWIKTKKDESQTSKLIDRVIDDKLTSRQLEKLVKDAADAPLEKKRERAFSRAEVSGPAKGELKAFEGKLTLQLEMLSDAKRDQLFRKILTLFEESGLIVDSAATDSVEHPAAAGA